MACDPRTCLTHTKMLACCPPAVSSHSKKHLGNMTALVLSVEDAEGLAAAQTLPMSCSFLHRQVYSRPSSLVSSSPQRSTSSDADGERQFNLNGNSVPTATQTLMTMYRRRSPEEFNPKLVGASYSSPKTLHIRKVMFETFLNKSKLISRSIVIFL